MKNLLLSGALSLAALAFVSCDSDDDANEVLPGNGGSTNFTVTIENVSAPAPLFRSGVANTPVGATSPGPLFPGDAYEFEVIAGSNVTPGDGGTRLSFVSMMVQSNDLFFAPDESGIALFENGMPIGLNGPVNVTNQVAVWDAGTEVNEATGGPNQKPQQSATAEDQGVDENGNVTLVTGTDSFGNVIPAITDMINVTVDYTGPSTFLVRVENVSNGTTIATPALGAGTTAAVPVSPIVWAVHTSDAPFFTEGQPAAGAGSVGSMTGVEDIAEDGFGDALIADSAAASGFVVPMSPGVWAVHDDSVRPLFDSGVTDRGLGLEGIAEDGSAGDLGAALTTTAGVSQSAVFNTPVGAGAPGPIGPGGSYSFSFDASAGDYLSFTTMMVQSNDWFYSFSQDGIPLFNNGTAVQGDVTDQVRLYDAGTEIDELPGAGRFQVIRQSGPNTGAADGNTLVRRVTGTEFDNIPANDEVILVTITAN